MLPADYPIFIIKQVLYTGSWKCEPVADFNSAKDAIKAVRLLNKENDDDNIIYYLSPYKDPDTTKSEMASPF